ncbi:MAG: hypothetical protein E7537_04595 [Ruminococcaceae bacterium]|nr:hypothetical protein [Oscillospiraceae bacterium]
MRQDICTIPVSEVFEVNDGCPICRMKETVEKRIVEYIMGAAMMEPDVRIETNKLGFCEKHFDMMLNSRGRLQLALILESHINEIGKDIFEKKLFNSASKKGDKAKKLSDSCFVCSKVNWGFENMIKTIFLSYENDRDFRDMFNSQNTICLPHYELLMNSADKKNLRKYSSEFESNLTRITGEYVKALHSDLQKYCSMYDYRANEGEKDWGTSKDVVERTVAFLDGRHYSVE